MVAAVALSFASLRDLFVAAAASSLKTAAVVVKPLDIAAVGLGMPNLKLASHYIQRSTVDSSAPRRLTHMLE